MADVVTIAVMYPEQWEVRPREELEADLDALAALDPRLRVIEARYADPDELRVRRGADPTADLRAEAPALSEEFCAAMADVDIAIAQDLPFDVATIAPNLKWVQGMGAGVSQLASAGLAPAGIRLTTAAGNNAVSISEFVIGRILQVWKRFDELGAGQQAHEWNQAFGRELAGSTVGIIGLGAIGTEIARRLAGFGVTVLASRASYQPGMTHPLVDELTGPDGLHDMLARCDVVVSAVPESPQTIDVMDAAAFAAMPAGSMYVNVGRGSFVVEDDLVDALTRGHLAAAALDVVREEPLPADSALWDAPNLALSPHCSSSADRYYQNLYALFRENTRRFLSGEALLNEVDPAKGY